MSHQLHHRACPLCEAMCGLTIETRGGEVTSIRGDEADPLSRGYLCPKATALKALHEDPDRLRQPLVRRGEHLVEVSWDEALDTAARGLHRVQREHGNDAVATYLGNPNAHNLGSQLFAGQFVRALRTRRRYSATSVDQLPHQLAAYRMFGHQLLLPVVDIDRTHYLLILGANPLASNGSLLTAPGMRRRLDALRARGGKVVVIDPRRTETAERADEHHAIVPGTDALFLLALLEALPALRLPPHLEACTDGVETIAALARRFPAERVASRTGIPAGVIRRLAAELASAPSAAVYGRMGTSVQPFGSVCTWLITVLGAVTGNLDRPGGLMFPSPAFDPRTLPAGLSVSRGSHGRWTSLVRALPEALGELPVATMAEDMLADHPRRTRALVTVAGNPVLSTPNGARLERAIRRLDFRVSVDPYLNETSRLADVVLPPVSPLERSQYDVVFHLLAVRNTARYSPPVFPPPPGARLDHQILLALALRLSRLRGRAELGQQLRLAATLTLGPEAVLELGLRTGSRRLSLARLARAPHGLDLGPLEPRLPGALFTSGRRIALAPAELVADVERVEQELLAPAPPLVLIGRRHLRDNNSWLHNVPRLVSGPDRCTLLMHPDDARARGLEGGQRVTVTSRVGAVTVPVEVTEGIRPGVVSLPHGYGHHREGIRLTVASAHPGASVNDLTDELRVDAPSGNAALSGVPVEVALAL